MKRVPPLATEPIGLATWNASNPSDAQATGADAKGAWERFKDSGGAYRELMEELLSRQQGLCGYCEQRLTSPTGTLVINDYQVEHVAAKSGSPGRALDWRNMMLCCGGGTWRHHKDTSRHLGQGGSENKLVLWPGQGRRRSRRSPRSSHIPVEGVPRHDRPRWPYARRANEGACKRVHLDPQALQSIIDDVLRLNCPRLKMHREKTVGNAIWFGQIIDETLQQSSHLTAPEAGRLRAELVGGRLRPDRHGHLRPFWTTERQYLDPPAEAWIQANATALHFE